MWIILFILIAASCLYFISKKPHYWLDRGIRLQAKHIYIKQHKFYVEAVTFNDYHQALHEYFYFAPQYNNRKGLQTVKYSYLDWTDAIFQYEDCTIQLVRRINKIYLVKSEIPMSISTFEEITLDEINKIMP